MNRERLMKMAGAVRTGGKGTMRRYVHCVSGCVHVGAQVPTMSTPNRKKKAVHKTTTTDDKRLQNTLKRLGVNTIPGIEEVNIFQDETVIHFTNPKGVLQMLGNDMGGECMLLLTC